MQYFPREPINVSKQFEARENDPWRRQRVSGRQTTDTVCIGAVRLWGFGGRFTLSIDTACDRLTVNAWGQLINTLLDRSLLRMTKFASWKLSHRGYANPLRRTASAVTVPTRAVALSSHSGLVASQMIGVGRPLGGLGGS